MADVEKGGRLVHEDGLRLLRQGHGEVGPLPLPAGKLRHEPGRELGGVRALQGGVHYAIVLVSVAPGVGEVGEAPVQGHAPDADARHPALLRHVRGPARDLARAQLICGPAVKEYFPGQAALNADYGLEQGALAAAVGSGQDKDLAWPELERDVREHGPAVVARGEIFEFNHACAPFSA